MKNLEKFVEILNVSILEPLIDLIDKFYNEQPSLDNKEEYLEIKHKLLKN